MLLVEAITNVGIGQQILRILRIVLNLFAQQSDKGAKVFEFASIFRSPDGFEQAGMRDGLAGVHHEVMKDFEFFRGEMNGATALHDSIFHGVEFEDAMTNQCIAVGVLGVSSAHC